MSRRQSLDSVSSIEMARRDDSCSPNIFLSRANSINDSACEERFARCKRPISSVEMSPPDMSSHTGLTMDLSLVSVNADKVFKIRRQSIEPELLNSSNFQSPNLRQSDKLSGCDKLRVDGLKSLTNNCNTVQFVDSPLIHNTTAPLEESIGYDIEEPVGIEPPSFPCETSPFVYNQEMPLNSSGTAKLPSPVSLDDCLAKKKDLMNGQLSPRCSASNDSQNISAASCAMNKTPDNSSEFQSHEFKTPDSCSQKPSENVDKPKVNKLLKKVCH